MKAPEMKAPGVEATGMTASDMTASDCIGGDLDVDGDLANGLRQARAAVRNAR